MSVFSKICERPKSFNISYCTIDPNWFSLDLDNECVDRVQEEMDEGRRKCPCGVDCEETDYEVTLSTSAWPSKGFEVRDKIEIASKFFHQKKFSWLIIIDTLVSLLFCSLRLKKGMELTQINLKKTF